MVNYFIYAKNLSASTSGVAFHHQKGFKTLKQFKSDVRRICFESVPEESRIIYLHWGHECVEVDEQTTVKAYNDRYANGNNTLPETIIEWIKINLQGDYKIKLLYIITDGQIGAHSLNKCLKLNENVEYEKVVFHGIHRNLNSIDLSVATSFLKGHCTVYRNHEKFDDTDISKEFDYGKISIDNFINEKENLKSYIKLKYINTSKNSATALTEIEKLKELRNKLFADLSQPLEKKINLETKDKKTFLCDFKETDWYKNLNSYDFKIDIEKSISILINYIVCDKKSYAFDALKFESKFSNKVSEEPIVDINFTTDQEVKFPDTTLDDEKGIPVILCTEFNLLDKIIFETSESTASYSKFKSLMECPLFLLNDRDLNETIGYFYTLNVYKQLLENTAKTEPRTQRPFHGGLVLVDTDDFDKYNDYILSATYFNFKKVEYNVGLFYFVLWKICEKKQWMDKNVIEQFKKYMLRRISTTKCKIGLSSLPLDPQMNTSLPTALWYCVELSSSIFKDDPQHFAHERLRMFYEVCALMIEILEYLKYDLDLESIDKRRDLIRHVMILKKIPTQRDKVFYLVEKIFKKVNGFLVCEIENQTNVKKLNYLKLNHKEMLNDDIIKGEVNLNDYVYFLHEIEDSEVQICKKTFRPFFMINQNMSFYSEVEVEDDIVVKHDGVDKLEFSRILSLYNLFFHYVKGYDKFPTLEEYKEYILKKIKYKDNLVSIFPRNVSKSIEEVFLFYESVKRDMSVKEFVGVCDKYVSRVERIKAENNENFESDSWIIEFISREERNVKVNQ
ncbi:hypothetical protein ABMA28_011806 [Loxostege sticticalis]|uniref:P94 n=1 Tax=Loxostege sticticalis TaxID=481309 RepID=A0ABD0TKJ7_LOXSC